MENSDWVRNIPRISKSDMDVNFSAMKENIIGSDFSLDILRREASVHYMEPDFYFKIKFWRQISVQLHFVVQ